MTVVNDNVKEILENFSERHSDQTFLMCYEMQPDRVIDEIIKPKHDAITSAGLFKPYVSGSARLFTPQIYLGRTELNKESSGGLHYFAGGLMLGPVHLENVIALCRVVDIPFHPVFLRRSLGRVMECLNSADCLELRNAVYDVNVLSDEKGKLSLHLAARGKTRLPNSTLAKFRKLLLPLAKADCDLAEVAVRSFLKELNSRMNTLLKGRMARGKSIETLLGI